MWWVQDHGRGARTAPDQTVHIADLARSEPRKLIHIDPTAPVALVTHNISQPSTLAAVPGAHRRGTDPPATAADQIPQLPALVQPLQLLGPADEPPADEHAGDGQFPAAGDALELVDEARVHGEVTLIDRDVESAEDRADGIAVLEGLPDHAEAGHVDHDIGKGRRRLP